MPPYRCGGIKFVTARAPTALLLTGALLALTCASGCGRSPARERMQTPKEPFEQLPGLRATHDPALRRELALLVDQRATPLLVRRALVPLEQNVAAPLVGLFTDDDLDYLSRQAESIAAAGGLPLEGDSLERGRSVLAGNERQLAVTRSALERPRCDLGIDPAKGAMADLALVRTARLAARWEAFAASAALAAGDLAAATEALVRSLRWAEHLARERHVVSRVEAAHARLEAISVLAHLVRQPGIASEEQAFLLDFLSRQLDEWPADAEAWIGDRAVGMHTYEVARRRKLIRLLTTDEIAQFEAEGLAGRFRRFSSDELDADERFYLATMRQLIDACRLPYYQRSEVFAQIAAEIEALESASNYPLVAARLLLADVEPAQRAQALDRAACEAYTIALSLALGRARPPFETNPLTGTAYRVSDDAVQVSVSPLGDGTHAVETAIVPRPAAMFR